MQKTKFYNEIAEDSKQALIQLVSEAGHGKTSSLRTIIAYIKEHNPEIVFKIFDVSQAWYHQAPVSKRQLVTRQAIDRLQIGNIEDCVYEIGALTKDEKRAFVGTILKQDWDYRYKAKLEGTLETLPYTCYVFEEANIYFGSYSFRTNDLYSPVFNDFVSVGRNYRMRGFLVATAEQGEIAPSLRRRSRKIYGRLVNSSDINEAKRTGVTTDLKNIPRYHFAYKKMVERVPDAVKSVPENHTHVPSVGVQTGGWQDSFWLGFVVVAGFLMLLLYFLGG